MTTSTSTSPAIERAANFLEAVRQTIEKDKGANAAMKRALTGEARHLRAVYPIVLYPLEREGIQYNQDEWIFVACLFTYYPQPIKRDDTRTFGHAARGLTGEGNSGGADRRFRALLDSPLEDLRSPLAALVRLLKSKGIAINYPQLILDLCRWEHPDQYVQDKWARAFWGASALAQPEQPGQNDENQDQSVPMI